MTDDLSKTEAQIERELPVVEETRLANGMRVVSLKSEQPSESDVVVLQLRLMSGSALDHNLPGLASFTASMLTRGSAGRNLEQISEELDGLGASIGVGAGRVTTDGSTKSLREVADRTVGILADALRRPDFPDDQIEIVRRQMLTSLRQSEDSTRSVASRLLRETMYPEGHPLHQRADGTEESLRAIARDDLVRHHEATYKPANAIVAVGGGISHDNAVQLAERHFGDWTGAPPEIDIDAVAPPAEVIRVSAKLAGKSQADIAIGTPTITRNHPDYYALSLANLIFGRFGLYGRLGESIRERQGLAYYAFSNFRAGRETGSWTASIGVDPQNVERAIASVLEELRRFNDGGPTAREYDDAIGHLLGSVPLGLETSSSRASAAADIAFYDLGADYLRRFRQIVRELTPEQTTAAMRTHVDPDRLIISVAGPDRKDHVAV